MRQRPGADGGLGLAWARRRDQTPGAHRYPAARRQTSGAVHGAERLQPTSCSRTLGCEALGGVTGSTGTKARSIRVNCSAM